jgi:protein arginine kinase
VANKTPELDVVLSCRVRLARNYEDVPFTATMTRDYAEETVRRARQAVESCKVGEYQCLLMKDLSGDDRSKLVEHHLISYDLLKFPEISAALIRSDECVSVMVNEEDHLRIQALLPGLQPEEAARLAFEADDALATSGPYAFDPQFGFLTSCPTNTGTGMRASAMLHLPALTITNRISAVVQAISKLGLTVRGLYGEGSDARGCLYQLSNQVTLGRSEEDIVKTLVAATAQLAAQERSVRNQLREQDAMGLYDRLMRSIGLMANARMMGAVEFMQRYSDLRMAVSMDMVDAKLPDVDGMMMDLQNASLNIYAKHDLNDRERDILRADQLRERIKSLS